MKVIYRNNEYNENVVHVIILVESVVVLFQVSFSRNTADKNCIR